MLHKKLFLLGLLFLTAQINCSSDFDSNGGPLHGIRQVSVGQNNIYFKKEIRGRNYEGLSISTDDNLCNSPSAKTDYFVNSETPGEVFYKVENDVLQIYSQSVFTAPQNNDFPVYIAQKYIFAQDFNESNALNLGFTKLSIPDDSLKTCDAERKPH